MNGSSYFFWQSAQCPEDQVWEPPEDEGPPKYACQHCAGLGTIKGKLCKNCLGAGELSMFPSVIDELEKAARTTKEDGDE